MSQHRVRYVGDRVAAVAAESREAAEEAMGLIEVHYEPLPAVIDPIKAMKPDAPVIHEDPTRYPGFPMQRVAEGIHNGQTRLHWSKGDIEQGFRDADLVMEHTFRIPSRHQGYLEPYASVLWIDDDGRVQVWCSSKSPFRTREQLSKAMDIPEESIKVNVVAVGGDFGGKGDARDLPIAYLLARETGRPVKIIMSFAEELTASNPSHPTVIAVKSGVMRDGTLVARKLRAIHASGAYGCMKPNAALSTWHYVGGGYRIPHSDFEFLQIYTNTVPGGYFRAPGAHQYAFAVECHTDILAQELAIDPVKFRLTNFVHSGEEDAIGRHLQAISAQEILQAAERAEMLPLSRGDGYGHGVALFGRQIGGGAAGAVLTAESNGSFVLISPTVERRHRHSHDRAADHRK